MGWATVQIGERSADVFTPSAPRQTDRALIFLHGYHQETLRHSPEYERLLEELRLPTVCPLGGRHWWVDEPAPGFDPWGTPLKFVAEGVTGWIASEWGIASPRIALTGISMGGQGALGLAYRQALRFPVVAAISPAIDFQIAHGKGFGIEEMYSSPDIARQATVTLNLHPLNWPRHQFFCCDPLDPTWFDGCQRLASKLLSSGVPFTADLKSSHGGHSWDYFNHQARPVLSWINQRLTEVVAEIPLDRPI